VFKDFKEAFRGLQIIESAEPDGNKAAQYHQAYAQWNTQLQKYL
jgi:hypothetical protein